MREYVSIFIMPYMNPSVSLQLTPPFRQGRLMCGIFAENDGRSYLVEAAHDSEACRKLTKYPKLTYSR